MRPRRLPTRVCLSLFVGHFIAQDGSSEHKAGVSRVAIYKLQFKMSGLETYIFVNSIMHNSLTKSTHLTITRPSPGSNRGD